MSPKAPDESQTLVERISLAVLLGAAIGSFATALRTWPAWVLLLPVAIALSWRPRAIPKIIVQAAPRLSWLFVSGAVVVGWFLVAYPILTTEQLNLWSLVIGYPLAFLACLFLLGSSVWKPIWTLLPATLGTLLVSTFHPYAPVQLFLVVAGGAGALFLWLRGNPSPAAATQPRSTRYLTRSLPLAVAGAGVFLMAWSIVVLLPLAQGRVEATLTEWYVAGTTGGTGLSPHSRLGELGKLKLSQRVALRVWTDRPQKLRAYVLTDFDGRQWTASAPEPGTVLPETGTLPLDDASQEWIEDLPGEAFHVAEEAPLSTEPLIRTKVLRASTSDSVLLSPSGASWIRVPLPEILLGYGDALTTPPPPSAGFYGVLQPAKLRAPEPASAQDLSKNLEIPEDTDPRLRELARRLSATADSPEQKVQKTVDYVSGCCEYSLDIGKIRSKQPVAEFLFEKKHGWCEYFASSAALLLRLQGVPTRYVTGYNVTESNNVGGHYLIRDSDAHAWIEAYIPGKGWVEADPTPAAEYEALHADLSAAGWLEDLTERVRASLALAWAVFREVDWRRWLSMLAETVTHFTGYLFIDHTFIAIAITVFLALVVIWKLRFRRDRPAGGREDAETRSVPPELLTWMDQLDKLWEKQGLARPRSKTPLEHLMALRAETVNIEVHGACHDLIDCFYRARFRRDVISAEELKNLGSVMEEVLHPESR